MKVPNNDTNNNNEQAKQLISITHKLKAARYENTLSLC